MNEDMTRQTVTVVMTVKNDPAGCALTLESLISQTRAPQEIVVVDGGSHDNTPEVVRAFSDRLSQLRFIEAPGANIAEGRNIGSKAATGTIIATTDAGCRAAPEWLEKLIAPFEADPRTEFVAGFYQIEPQSLLEQVVGLATMRGQLDPVDPATFNPSGRSMAYTKTLWERAGGWPAWLGFSEDTLFDHKLRRMNVRWAFAGDAVVHWRPRTTLRKVARQFYNYGTGRGHTNIGARDFAYNLRNLAILGLATALCFVAPIVLAECAPQSFSPSGGEGRVRGTMLALLVATALFLYFYIWTFHAKAVRIARRSRNWRAYPLTILVMWIVLASNLLGYVIGCSQRFRHRHRYQRALDAYMGAT